MSFLKPAPRTAAVLLLLLLFTPQLTHAAFEPSFLYDDLAATLSTPDTPTILVLLAPWCAACRAMRPMVAALGAAAAADGAAVTVGVVDTDEEPGVAPKFGVTAFPTILYFPPGYALARGKARTAPPVSYAPREGDSIPRPSPAAWPVAYGDHRQAPMVAAWANALAGSPVLVVEEGPAYAAWLASVGGVLPPIPSVNPVTVVKPSGSDDDGDAGKPPVYLDREGGEEVTMELTPISAVACSPATFWSAVAGHRQALVLWGAAAAETGVADGMASALMGSDAAAADHGRWVVGVLSDPPGVGEPAGGAAVVDVSAGAPPSASADGSAAGTGLWGAADVMHCPGWGFGELFECINLWSVHRAKVQVEAEGGDASAIDREAGWVEGDIDGGPGTLGGTDAARAAARVGSRAPDGGWRRAAAAAPTTTAPPDRETVDEAALRAADIQEALADLAKLRCRMVHGEERLGSPSTETSAARRLRAMDALTASLEAELGALEFAR
ncbi:hypothetical protein MMPV_007870 [Pyropia vietnamensis]